MKKHIRIIGLSSHIDHKMIEGGINWLEKQNFTVSVADQVYSKNFQSAGTINDKIEALHNAYLDSNVDIILISCGGNGAIHLLDHIDFDFIKKNPKPIIGFSDMTVILNAIHARGGSHVFHGPTATQLGRPLPDEQMKQFLDAIAENKSPISWNDCSITNKKNTSGILIGGNLSVFQTVLGTPYLPQDDDIILFLEDVGDEISRYDRMLAHIKQSGLFDRCSAILFGDFHAANNPARVPFGKTMDDIITDLTSDLKIPIITGAPFGHRGQLATFPIGQTCYLNFDDNYVTLSFDNDG